MAYSESFGPIEVLQSLDVEELLVDAVERLCFKCGKNGTTRFLLSRIPFYKELKISSFACRHCRFNNNQVDPAKIKTLGVRITLIIENEEDLHRFLVTSDYTSMQIPELDFEMPPMSEPSQVTTVEGIIDQMISNLQDLKSIIEQTHPEMAEKMDFIIDGLKDILDIDTLISPVPIVFEDVTGNIFVSNPIAPETDPRIKTEMFIRNSDQNKMIGLSEEDNAESIIKPLGSSNDKAVNNIRDKSAQFSSPCPNCDKNCETYMKVTDIPFFKQVVIVAICCEKCGYHTNEVKPGGGIEKQGVIITVGVSSPEDLNRDILKSETCSLRIPQIGFEVDALSLSARFTTIEGLLTSIYGQVKDTATVFYIGDSYSKNVLSKTEEFLSKLNKIKACEMPVDVILVDPAGNSYVQNSEKRSRATNFSFREKELLLKIALENRHILENKESNAISWKDKNKCWLKIAEVYNSTTTGCPRDSTSLRLKYECVKKLLRGTKSDHFKTGGGPYKDPYTVSSDSEKALYQILQLSIDGLRSQQDSDNFENIASEHKTTKQNQSPLKQDTLNEKENVLDGYGYDLIVSEENESLVQELGLEDAFNVTFETPMKNFSTNQQPGTSGTYKDTQSWTPSESTKLLRTTEKHKKLTTNFRKKNHCQASASEKFTILAEKKQELVELQISYLKEEHDKNMTFLKTKHALELQSLELDIAIKKQKLDRNV